MLEYKKCNKCLVDLEILNFNKDKSQKDGLEWSCRSCRKLLRDKLKSQDTKEYIRICRECKNQIVYDSYRGYIVGNLWWINKNVNAMKLWLELDEFKNYCKLVYTHLRPTFEPDYSWS